MALPWQRLADLDYAALRRLQVLAEARLSVRATGRPTGLAAPTPSSRGTHPHAAVSCES
eukprot:COSAG02_NODE_49702_length_325_cov_0.690265_1_plen_58_part_10